MDLLEDKLYEVVGADGFARLVRGFYAQVPGDDILGPMYPAHELGAAEQRLRDFLIQRIGGPKTYSAQRGHPRLRMRHMPFRIDQRARDRWMQLMTRALAEAQLGEPATSLLAKYFADTATFMINTEG